MLAIHHWYPGIKGSNNSYHLISHKVVYAELYHHACIFVVFNQLSWDCLFAINAVIVMGVDEHILVSYTAIVRR